MSFIGAILVSKALTKQREKDEAERKGAKGFWLNISRKREREERERYIAEHNP